MTTAIQTPTWIRIEAPDARAALRLEQRLAHLHPSAVGQGETWSVELEDFDGRLPEIEAAVRYWLGQIGLPATVVHVNDARRTVTVHELVREPLGSGYDGGPALEHEP